MPDLSAKIRTTASHTTTLKSSSLRGNFAVESHLSMFCFQPKIRMTSILEMKKERPVCMTPQELAKRHPRLYHVTEPQRFPLSC